MNSTRKPLNLIKSPIFTSAPCKSTCLDNAPSLHIVENNLGLVHINKRVLVRIHTKKFTPKTWEDKFLGIPFLVPKLASDPGCPLEDIRSLEGQIFT